MSCFGESDTPAALIRLVLIKPFELHIKKSQRGLHFDSKKIGKLNQQRDHKLAAWNPV